MGHVNLTTFIFSLSSKLEEDVEAINPHSDQGTSRRAEGEYESFLMCIVMGKYSSEQN